MICEDELVSPMSSRKARGLVNSPGLPRIQLPNDIVRRFQKPKETADRVVNVAGGARLVTAAVHGDVFVLAEPVR